MKGVIFMQMTDLEKKIVQMAKYYTSPLRRCTMRDVGKKFGMSSSTVGRYFKTVLPKLSPKLSEKVKLKSIQATFANQERFRRMVTKNKER